tara:strand:- start:657 stop:851 length:195 start_codon:yes stop_codon:yes gene_type:complete
MKYSIDKIDHTLRRISNNLNDIELKKDINNIDLIDTSNIPILYCLFIISALFNDLHIMTEYDPD